MEFKALIMVKLSVMREALALVFIKPKYIFIAAAVSLLIFFALIFLTNIPLFLQAYKINSNFFFFTKVSQNIINTILEVSGPVALTFMVLISILAGINISMLIFKQRFLPKRKDFASLGGLLTGAVGAGCPACSTSILSILGVTGGLAILPLKGLEFTSLSAVLLIVSLYFISKGVNSKTCKIAIKK